MQRFCYRTGSTTRRAMLRIRDAAGLRRSDIDTVAGTGRVALVEIGSKVHEGPPKTAARRRAKSLPSSVTTGLARHLEQLVRATYVFSSRADKKRHDAAGLSCRSVQ